MTAQRVLAAVLFTDTVGFTKRTGENEEEAFNLLTQDFAVMRELATRYQGEVKKSTGDGLLMVFKSAQHAVTCAVEIQRNLTESAKQNPRALRHRIGIHLGDVMLSEQDVVGDGVNVANRLQGEAQPGAICMSQTVYDMVKTKLPMQVKDLGERQLRNVTSAMQVYEIPAPFSVRIPRPPKPAYRKPKKANPGIVAAIVFAGVCILGGTVMLTLRDALRARNRASNYSFPMSQSRPNGVVMSPSVTETTGDNAATPNPPPTPSTDSSKPIETLDDLAAATPKSDPAKSAYDQASTQYKASYDFQGMAAWLDTQDWSPTTSLKNHWHDLQAFKDAVVAGLSKTAEYQPLDVNGDLYYAVSPTRIVFAPKGGSGLEMDLADLKPEDLFAIAKALNLSQSLVKAFQIEYGLG